MQPEKDFYDPASIADFLAQMGVDPAIGLTREEAMTRRSMYGMNRVTAPVNCPSWLCCLLPCLLRTPAMQTYQRVLPQEALVRRAASKTTSRKLRMDAASVVFGDVVEVHAGEIVSADLRVIECSADCVVDQSVLLGSSDKQAEELENLMEAGHGAIVAPQKKTVGIEATNTSNALASGNVLAMATTLVRGHAVGVVIATGDDTIWGQMLEQHLWPVA